MSITIERIGPTLGASGNSRSSHYNLIDQGLWTPSVKTGARSVGWPKHENDAINAARIAGKPDDQIRQLVRDLIAARERLFDTELNSQPVLKRYLTRNNSNCENGGARDE